MTRRVRERGFTLQEVVIVLAILAILLAIGIPRFQVAQSNRDLDGAYLQVRTLLTFARQTAAGQNGTTVNFTAGPPLTCTILSATNQVLQSYTGPGDVSLTPPSGVFTFVFNSGGAVSNGGVFVFTSTVTGRTETMLLNTLTGGVVTQ